MIFRRFPRRLFLRPGTRTLIARITLPPGYSAVTIDFDPTEDTTLECGAEVCGPTVVGRRHMIWGRPHVRCLCKSEGGPHTVWIRAAQANKRPARLRLTSCRIEPIAHVSAPAVHFGDNTITISMATYPEREAMLADVLPTIVDQADNMMVYCNNYREAPSCVSTTKAHYVVDTASSLKAAAKFTWMNERGYQFTVDDDIFYPSDYVEVMVHWLEHYKRKALVGVHGFNLPTEVMKFPWRTRSYPFQDAVTGVAPVHVIGTGTLALHQSLTAQFPWAMMRLHPASNDECLGVIARKRNVPLLVVPREKDWLQLHPQMKFGLFEEKGLNPSLRTPTLGLLKQLNPWGRPALPEVA